MSCATMWNPEAVAPDETPDRGPTILLVEDEDFVREVTCEVLQFAGYRVLKAREAVEASVAFRRNRQEVRLLITDIVMPGQNGRDLAHELRSVCPGLRTIFVSGYPEIPQEAEKTDTMRYLTKPYSAESLVGAVRAILEQAEDTEMPPRAAGDNE